MWFFCDPDDFAMEPSFHLARPLAGFGSGLYFGKNLSTWEVFVHGSILKPASCPEIVLMVFKITAGYEGNAWEPAAFAFLELEKVPVPSACYGTPHPHPAFLS